jgi:exonuclease III
MAGNTTYFSMLTLNVNGFNSPIKRYRSANWIKKEDPTICCFQEIVKNIKRGNKIKNESVKCKKATQGNAVEHKVKN